MSEHEEPAISDHEERRDRPAPDAKEIPDREPLAEEPTAGGDAADVDRAALDSDLDDEPLAERRPVDPVRSLLRLGWAVVAMLVVVAALLIAGMLRISNAVDNVACVQKAQTGYISSIGPGSNASTAGLGRLVLRITLNKCGR